MNKMIQICKYFLLVIFLIFFGCIKPPADVISSVYNLKSGDRVKLNVDSKYSNERIYRYFNENSFGPYTFQRTLETKIHYGDRQLIASPGDWGTVIEVSGNVAKVEFNSYYLHFQNSSDGAICLETQKGVQDGYMIDGGGWYINWYITTGTVVQTSSPGISWEWQSVFYSAIIIGILLSLGSS